MRFEDEYRLVRTLGCGGMATVELWRRLNFDQGLVCAKRCSFYEMSGAEEQLARHEAQVLRKLKHPNVVKYFQSWVNKKDAEIIIIQEYCEGGDLSQAIKTMRSREAFFPTDRVMRWVAQLLHALLYCHKTFKMMHRDLKPGNIFLSTSHHDVRIGDFGIAKDLGSTKSLCNTFIGTAVYMSPEVVRMQRYGLKSDVWGLGAIAYEVCTLQRPFAAKTAVEAMNLIVSPEATLDPFPESCGFPQELEAAVGSMLTKKAEARPSLESVLRSYPQLHEACSALEAEYHWEDSLLPSLADPTSLEDQPKTVEVSEVNECPHQHVEISAGNRSQEGDPTEALGVSEEIVAASGLPASGGHLRTITEAVGICSLVELTSKRAELEALVEQVQPQEEASTPRDMAPPPPPPGAPARWSPTADEHLGSGTGPAVATALGEQGVAELAMPDLLTIFRRFDHNGNDTIGRSELQEALVKLDPAVWTTDKANRLLACADRKGDGCVNIEEFAAWICGGSDEARSLIRSSQQERLTAGKSVVLPRKPLTPKAPPSLQAAQAPLGVSKPVEATAEELRRHAAIVDARLHCLEVIEGAAPDPAELTLALRNVEERGLAAEECGQALLMHAHRLRLRAEDTITREGVALAEIERATEVLEVVQRVGGMQVGPSLERATRRLNHDRAQQQQIGLRCTCEGLTRLISVPCDTNFAEVSARIARAWGRPLDSLRLSWREGVGAVVELSTEEQWRICVSRHPAGSGPVEVVLAPIRKAAAGRPPRRRARGSELQKAANVGRPSAVPSIALASKSASAAKQRAASPQSLAPKAAASGCQPRRVAAEHLVASSAAKVASPSVRPPSRQQQMPLTVSAVMPGIAGRRLATRTPSPPPPSTGQQVAVPKRRHV